MSSSEKGQKQLTTLQKAFQKVSTVSRGSNGASNVSRFLKDLESHCLFISDAEVPEEDVPMLCKFIATKTVDNILIFNLLFHKQFSQIYAIYIFKSF